MYYCLCTPESIWEWVSLVKRTHPCEIPYEINKVVHLWLSTRQHACLLILFNSVPFAFFCPLDHFILLVFTVANEDKDFFVSNLSIFLRVHFGQYSWVVDQVFLCYCFFYVTLCLVLYFCPFWIMGFYMFSNFFGKDGVHIFFLQKIFCETFSILSYLRVDWITCWTSRFIVFCFIVTICY